MGEHGIPQDPGPRMESGVQDFILSVLNTRAVERLYCCREEWRGGVQKLA